MRTMNTAMLIALLASTWLPGFAVAQGSPPVEPAYKPTTTFHGESPPLSELARNPVPVAFGNGQIFEDELEELFEAYEPPYQGPLLPTPFVQTVMPRPLAAVAGVSFEGPGVGLAGFTMTGAPPDMTLAVGPNHIIAWVNSQYAVFNKSGATLVAPTNGNALFVGMGNVCETTNRGDPILQYDRLANRWILSQFAFSVSGGSPVSPYLQCFAISTTPDPTGTWYRYSVQFSGTSPSGFNDYGKLGVWPDGYYTGYNIFGGSPAGGNTGAGLCASDRVKMLAGDPTATTLCAPIGFYAGGAAFLPADLDGTTLPSNSSQGGIFMRLQGGGAPALRFLKLKPDFAAGTVTINDGFGGASGSFINLPLPATTLPCNGTGGTCVAQPGTANKLDTLGSRLMYRLAYRNRGGIESMMVNHSVDPDGAGARSATMRWYEIRNPLGNPADPVVANRPNIYQNGTYDPGAIDDRWMGSIAMDGAGNMMAGYSIANATAGLKPSIAVAGREAGDALNTLQAESVAVAGTGSQTGTLTRWGDYSTIQVDPVDDRTFWYVGQYLAGDGTFNWRSRIVSYVFPPATLSIAAVSQVEGNSGTSNMVFTITRSNNKDDVTVKVNTDVTPVTAGIADPASDYTALLNQTVSFSAGGALTATVSVPIIGDTILEPNETFVVRLSNPTQATITTTTATGTITNDDSASLSINDVSLAEGNSGTTNFVFTVTLAGAVQGGFTLPYSTANGTATQPSDYASSSGTLTFTSAANQTKTITVAVVGDTVPEPNETFTVNLGASSNGAIAIADGSGLGTIINDDTGMLSINDVTLVEGNSGTTNFVFSVTLGGAVAGGFTLPYSTSDGTASQPSDYTPASGTLTFAGSAGEVKQIIVPVKGDTILEPNETFTVNLGTPSSPLASVSDGTGLGTINNDDAASLAVSDVTLLEGNSGTTAFVFNVTLTGAVQGGFTLPYSTANGTATSPNDYVNTSGTLTFTGSAGEVKTVSVAVVGDTILEPNETFALNIGAPSNAAITVSDGSGLGTITNDDAASVAVSDVTLFEGNSGTTAFVFNVTLTGAVQGGFTLPYSTANGTATSPSDYANTSGTLTFAGTAGEVKTISVAVVGNTILEPNETFAVNIGAPSNAAVAVSDGSGLGTITNDDAASLAVSNVTLLEGNSGTTSFVFNVTLTGAVQGGFSLPYNTANGTATSPSDYSTTNGSLAFAGSAGEEKTVSVAVVGDTIVEANETFALNISAPSNAAITVSGSGLGTINNDDSASIAINNISLAEGNSGTTNFTFNVTLTGAVQDGFTVPFSTANGTATTPSDYANTTGTLSFAGTNAEVKTITVPVVGDLVPELDETFLVNLAAASVTAVTASQAQGTATILNDDLFADISASISDSVTSIVPGDSTVYTLTVTNTSTIIDVAAVSIVQTVPATLTNITWTCSATGGATCASANGNGAISQTRAMPKGSTITYLVSARVDPAATAPPSAVTTSVDSSVLAPYSDPTTANNTASDSNTLILDVIFRNGFDSVQ